MEICIGWEGVYISRMCSNRGISDVFDMQRFIHKIVTLDNKVTISYLCLVILG